MIRILYIISGLKYGGAEKLLYSTCKCLKAEFQADIDLISLDRDAPLAPLFAEMGVRVFFMKKSPFILLKIITLIQKNRYQVIHTHLIHADILGRTAAWFSRIFYHPLLFSTTHDNYWFRWKKSPFCALVRAGDRFLAKRKDSWVLPVSETIFETLVHHERIPQNRIHLLRNAVEIPQLLVKRGRHPQKLRCLFIGRLIPEKNVSFLLQVFSQLASDSVHLTIVGSGPLEPEIAESTRVLKLADRVTLKPPVPFPDSLYREHDVMILPSLVEGLPMVVLEAFSHGLPVLGSDIPGIRDLLADGRGTLFPVNKVEFLTDLLQHAGQYYDTWLRQADNARDYVLAHHSMAGYTARLYEMYSGTI
jgi:glycosyltransferase involved in cell wall biosynthesis